MAECPGGRANRGIRSQFRLPLPGLGLGKGIYPIHLGDIMDAGQSIQRNIPSSPNKLTLTVREYEQSIEKLTKENFDLKLKLYLYEEKEKKGQEDKDSVSPNHIQVIVQLKSETESLHNELRSKDELLKDALERADRFESDFKDLEKKYADLQSELSSLSELPSKENFLSLQDEKDNLIKYTETLEKVLSEKEEAVHDANQKIEFLDNRIRTLEEKIKKRSLAIQGFVYKNYKEKEMLPDELRNIVISATQAAKNKNKDNLAVAVKNITFCLNQMMSMSVLSEEKENIASPPVKCLKKETLEKSNSSLPSHSESAAELSHIQSLKEVLTERKTSEMNLNAAAYTREKSLHESDVNMSERVITEFIESPAVSPTTENLISFSNRLSPQHSNCPNEQSNFKESDQLMKYLDGNKKLKDYFKKKLELIDNLHENCLELELKVADLEKAESDASDKNEKLKGDLQEKLALIQDLQAGYDGLELKRVNLQEIANDRLAEIEMLKHALNKQHPLIQDLCDTCKRLDVKGVHLQDKGCDASRTPILCSVYTQTDIAGYNLLNDYELTKLQKDAELSNNVEELREDILLLLLAVEDKNKELSAVKQSLSVVQEDLKRALNTSAVIDKDFYESERNDLHSRLAFSCSVNEELMKQLKNLKKFMEDLLQNKFDSSVESINEITVSKCLDQSLQLSNILSDHLSFCEGSKLFEDCETSIYNGASYSGDKSNFLQALSRRSLPEQYPSYLPGAHILEEYISYAQNEKNGKELDASQLYLQCWQHVNNTSQNQTQTSHLVQNNIISRHVGYASSDSDIWSEPDRNVSLQRIGISLQNSPVSSKSPRKLRQKEKRLSSRLSSEQDTSSSELRCTSKKRHATASRRLSFKEIIKNQDFTSEKFYFLLTEKYNKLKGLLDELDSIENAKLSSAVWICLNTVVASLGGTLQKLHIARESARDFPSAVCGRCAMLELFTDIKASHKEVDFFIDDSPSEQAILEQFSNEIRLLKEACKEAFPLFSESTDRKSQSAQRDTDLEDVIAGLKGKNREICQKLKDVEAKNFNLSDEINDLKQELSKLKQIESELCRKNEKLVEELSHVNENNCELNKVLSDLEQKSRESGFALDNLTAELQKNKTELVSMNERCLDYEKKLSEQIQMKNECEYKLKTLETYSLSEKNYLSKIDDLNAERNRIIQELQSLQEEKMALENENTLVNNNLQSKISEIVSLQDTVKRLSNEKETLNIYSEELQITLKSAKENLKNLQQKWEKYEAEFSHQFKELEAKSSAEKEKLISEISLLTNKNASINDSLQSKENELLSLKIELKSAKEDLKHLQEKCNEEMIAKYKEYEAEYSRKFNELETKFLAEKKKLLNEISLLTNKNANINHSLQSKEHELLSLEVGLNNAREDLKNLQKKCDEKMSIKFKEYKTDYSRQLKELEAKSLAEKEKLLSEISLLTNENASINDSLQAKENELLSLQELMEKHQWDKETLNTHCKELQIQLKTTKENLEDLESKCHVYEGTINIVKENEVAYCQRFKEIEETSLAEKNRLVEEISFLKKEKEQISEKLKDEQVCYQKLKTKQTELSENYVKSCTQLTNLKLLNEELKRKQQNLLQRNEFYKNALQSSNNECDTLNQDLKCMRDTLQNLESKCLAYEKQLTASAGLKDCLVECLLNINNEFLVHRQKLNEMFKTYGYENYILWDEPPANEYVPAIDGDNIQNLCENISSESKKLFQSIDMLFGFLKSVHLKSSEPKSPKDKSFIKKQMKTHESENVHLKTQTDNLQHVIDELQNCIAQKEKSIQLSAVEIQSLKENLCYCEQEIERENQLLKNKDDEITKLQERIFNLQTYINSIIVDKGNLLENSPCAAKKPSLDSISPDNQLPSQTTSKMCKTTDNENADESFASGSSLDLSRNSCCEKYLKKYRSLQTKLALFQKRIEFLEKEKKNLRENFLEQLQSKEDEAKTNSTSLKLTELESKLEQKKTFICELKNDLLKTCNSLIDKEKEIDDLKQKLSECEAKIKHKTTNVSDRHSIGVPKSIESNVKNLKQHKWKLIQAIFDIQRKFYEKRGIHLSYSDRFKKHLTNLYSMQLTQPLSKSESLPLLETCLLKEQYEPQNENFKNLLGLELDIECLENLKIFLTRFFVPDASQTQKEEKNPSDKVPVPTDVERKESSLDITEVLSISFPDYSVTAAFEDPSALKIFSFDIFASVVSHNLDCMQKFFSSVEKYQWLKELDLSAEESTDKAEVKLLLLKIFQETKSLQEGLHKLFKINERIKTYDFVSALRIPSNATKLDVSDGESVMSEVTIAVSRTESLEDVDPLKMTHPETLQLEEETLKPVSVGSKVAVIEPFGAKVTAISSSCDSVCQRSHYSSPDLGIESDPNHDSSAPEQKEEGFKKHQKMVLEEDKFLVKSKQRTPFTSSESAGRWSGHKFGETLYAIGNLQHYELLRQEVKESLVAIKSVLSRTGDGLHHIAKYSSPRKTLEFNTLKSIKDTCVHLEVCLKKANDLVNKFWTAPCPSEKEWKLLNDENQSLSEQLTNLKNMLQKRENEFKKALGKLEHAKDLQASMEKKISKKLVKTKKVIRQAELKLLETRCQNFPPVPKYPSDQSEQIDTMHQT